MNNIKNNKIRKKIDTLDKKLLKIIKRRTSLVNEVIKVKKTKKQIVDRKRIKKVLINIKKLSIKMRIDSKITNRIWKSMINGYIDYEKRNFRKR